MRCRQSEYSFWLPLIFAGISCTSSSFMSTVMLARVLLPMTPHRKERRKRPSLSPRKRMGKPRISDPYQIPRSEESTVKPSATNQTDISDDPTIDTNITFFDDAKKE